MVLGFTQGSSSPHRLGPTLGWKIESFQDSKGAPAKVISAGFKVGNACPVPKPSVGELNSGVLAVFRCVSSFLPCRIVLSPHVPEAFRCRKMLFRHRGKVFRHRIITIRHRTETFRHGKGTIRHRTEAFRHRTGIIRHRAEAIRYRTEVFRCGKRLGTRVPEAIRHGKISFLLTGRLVYDTNLPFSNGLRGRSFHGFICRCAVLAALPAVFPGDDNLKNKPA